MTATALLDRIARELKTEAAHVRGAIDLLDAGLSAPFIGRFRRAEVGGLNENQIRRIDLRRRVLEELDRRRNTILRALEKEESAKPTDIARIQACMDRFELEDLFLPHRRPEPEVQLSLDRGLGSLADALVVAVPGAPVSEGAPPAVEEATPEATPEQAPDEVPAEEEADLASTESAEADSEEVETPAEEEGDVEVATADEVADAEAATDASEPAAEDAAPAVESAVPAPAASPSPESLAQPDLTPELALLCRDYVNPDKGIHTEAEALEGAIRILSDRLGRNPRLRSTLRSLMRKQGVLQVKPMVVASKAGRHKSLLKLNQPLRQVQGHKLLALRRAQKDRVLTTRISIDHERGMEKVLGALSKRPNPAFSGVHRVIAARALERRLIPMLEEEIRLELKERADEEALRFLAQHLRRVLLTDPHTRRSATAGLHVDPKGDWVIAVLDPDGLPVGEPLQVAVGDRSIEELGADLAALAEQKIEAMALANGKTARTVLIKLRKAFAAAKLDCFCFLVSDAGLASYANSEVARKELADMSVHVRMAISSARRLQDPLRELLKVDPRHMGLGPQQGLVSKANVKRVFNDVIESCVSYVGCDLNLAPAVQLAHLPGLDAALAEKLVARRAERPFERLEELREEGLLDESAWASAAAFLRIRGSAEPLDRTNLHPEQYAVARRLIEAAGSTPEEAVGKPNVLKGLKRADFDVDPDTWRDLLRELAYPGRDPRRSLRRPELLDPETDPSRLTAGRVLDGVVASVSNFAAFVDVGLEQDAILHVSEITDRYVRDAREVLSIGQVVRAKIIESSDKRMTLSLKRVPRKGDGGGKGERSRPQSGPQIRPRRDGMGGAKQPRQFGGPGRGRRSGPGGDRRDGRGKKGKEDVRVDLRKVNKPGQDANYNPFADFFKDQDS
ncbi:MAG: S1 RNA-binding domain-containing protein [Planctomycetes bacterium]|nr:S1 RNA-binding domain-containing protein [Planctomycetota bacterium]